MPRVSASASRTVDEAEARARLALAAAYRRLLALAAAVERGERPDQAVGDDVAEATAERRND